MKPSFCLLLLTGAAVAASACASTATDFARVPALDEPSLRVRGELKAGRISHVFVIVQENRTVDNLFNGLPGANTIKQGRSGNRAVLLKPVPIETDANYSHKLSGFLEDTKCPQPGGRCLMNGFSPPTSESPGAYAFVDPSYTKPYFAMAEQYAFGDNMFPSNIDASFVSHQYLIAAEAMKAVDFPATGDACASSNTVQTITEGRQYSGFFESACFDYTTIGDELAAKSLTWRYYEAKSAKGPVGWWNPFSWVGRSVPGGTIVQGPSNFITDVQNRKRRYGAAVTWITPTLANSDHSGFRLTTNHGPDWVAAVVNAIGKSSLWDSSVIFVTWDDWGGWYDHVSPPYKDYDGLGIRVPFIIISAYTKKGLVTHVQYEQASILKYVEDLYDVAPLEPGGADGRATDPVADVMSNHSIKPRPFATISANAYSRPDDPGAPDTDR